MDQARQPDDTAKTAYDTLAAEYETVSTLTAAAHCPHTAREHARIQLAYARRHFRIAALQAPGAGESSANFDASLASIRRMLDAARAAIDHGSGHAEA